LKNEIKFSFIIPCLNEADNINACLSGIPNSPEIEIIVVDGGSKDATLNIIESYSRQIIILTSASGRSNQMNLGARHAKGEIFIFLHADCLLPEDCFFHLERFKNQTVKLWGRFDVRLKSQHKIHRVIYQIIGKFINIRSAWSDVATGDQGIFVKREIFESVGGYPEILLMEDIALSKRLRILSRSFQIKSPITTSARRWEENGIVKTILLMWIFRFIYMLGVNPNLLHKIYYAGKVNQTVAQKELLIVFSKNPEIGKVKTRLISHIGEQCAYDLYKAMLEQTLENCVHGSKPDRFHEMWIRGDYKNSYLENLAAQHGLSLQQQVGNDLGASLSHAFLSSKDAYQSIIVIGGDCVSINFHQDSEYLEQAFTLLKEYQVVIGPARDGGFVLVGFQSQSFVDDIFVNIDWGTSKVLEQLLNNIAARQLKVRCMDTLWDVDEFQDLVLLKPFPKLQKILQGLI